MAKGITAIGGLMGITIACWALTTPTIHSAFMGRFTQLLGGLSLVGFAVLFIIASRVSIVDDLFHGLDKAYVVHKWVAIITVGIVAAHLITHGGAHTRGGLELGPRRGGPGGGGPGGGGPGSGGGPLNGDGPFSGGASPSALLGALALIGFIVLLVVALTSRKSSHEGWKTVHSLMAVPYCIGLVHYYSASQYDPFGLNPFSVWLMVVNGIGVVAMVYSVILCERLAFCYKYTVTGCRSVGEGNLEITATPLNKELQWKPGQFTFIKFPRWKGFSSHPFTIASAPGNSSIQFAIRALGDHTTALPSHVKVGDQVVATKAHGRFDYRKGSFAKRGKDSSGRIHQIWIAGGVGVTPFRSFILAGVPSEYVIDFFYSYQGDQGAYLDELSQPIDGLRTHLVDTSVSEFLSVQTILDQVKPIGPMDVYFCGPAPMRKALQQEFTTLWPHPYQFHSEEFTFGR
ncbi:MAG: ferric reductase-like transmembrane domain-containing protein [Propionibacteriaceae bacterium]|nr:ferric reductase-like transmembrane domain-containing protein [Propionibacteriaceae bacterium]